MTPVFLPANFMTADQLALAIVLAVLELVEPPPDGPPNGSESVAAIGFACTFINWETKIARHYREGTLLARNALSRDRVRPGFMPIERVVFSLADIQASAELADGELQFELAGPKRVDPAPKPVQRSHAQGARVLELIQAQGHDPKRLPKPAPGKPGVKALVRDLSMQEPSVFTLASFKKTWDQLRATGEIADA